MKSPRSEEHNVVESAREKKQYNKRTGKETINQWEVLSELGRGRFLFIMYKKFF
jgi:hypothetical protein